MTFGKWCRATIQKLERSGLMTVHHSFLKIGPPSSSSEKNSSSFSGLALLHFDQSIEKNCAEDIL